MSITEVAARPATGPHVPPPYDPERECMKIMEAFEIMQTVAEAEVESMNHIKVLLDAFEPTLRELYEHLAYDRSPTN